ncbi:MAG: 50S ribosomal protein L1 [Proteobacteria bacterium]|nr:50S ribosomal protein L1 [Pseudomonadota bacterium]
MRTQGKKYLQVKDKVQVATPYPLKDAISLLQETCYVKFDETVDVAIRLGVDPRKADQMVRGTVLLPHGTGKEIKVLVFAKGEKEKEARDAGGPRGLMPNPKLGTVTFNVRESIDELRKGKVEFRTDKAGIVHVPVGKRSFDIQKLYENILALMDTIVRMKPSSSKGVYLKNIVLSSTMGLGIKVDPATVKTQ